MCGQIKVSIKHYLIALSLILGLGLGVIPLPAHAVTFDFAALVDDPLVAGVVEGAWSTQPTIGGGAGWTVGGVNVDASATGGVAYLDAGGAGLGVCGAIVSGVCAPSSDDNLQSGETLTLTFDRTLTLTDLLFKNATHGLFSGTVLINTLPHTVMMGVLAAVLVADNSVWTFGFGGSSAAEFYVSSVNAVPLPAAGILFGSALIGIGFLSRRRRKKQNTQAVI